MSVPPQYPQHQQPYPQQPYGQQPYPHPQQPYGQPYGQPMPQPPAPPRRPQASPLRGLITAVVLLAIFGGGAWYVYDYNTNPNGGKAKKEAERTAKVDEAKKHQPQRGDCVKIEHPDNDPLPTIVDCGSPEAQYKMGETLLGADKHCGPEYAIGLRTVGRFSNSTMCFTKV
ncbi:hypothetical protein [Streptomyces sp. NPDC049585]|uniref:LppU/SCO3897 family protein n=1 Tax=Streptomyces sp. NPDC049585 TaxID=3155154 RepID=UPI00342D82A0